MTIKNREQHMPIRERLKFMEHLCHLAMIDIDTENGGLWGDRLISLTY